jgi:uncharacterized protein YidB (DUF937 family)
MDLSDEVKGLIESEQLSGLVEKFKASGLDEQVSSWISKGENLPIAGDQIEKVLGNDVVAGIAAKLGIAPREAADELAQAVPKAIDERTPEGSLPSASSS